VQLGGFCTPYPDGKLREFVLEDKIKELDTRIKEVEDILIRIQQMLEQYFKKKQ